MIILAEQSHWFIPCRPFTSRTEWPADQTGVMVAVSLTWLPGIKLNNTENTRQKIHKMIIFCVNK